MGISSSGSSSNIIDAILVTGLCQPCAEFFRTWGTLRPAVGVRRPFAFIDLYTVTADEVLGGVSVDDSSSSSHSHGTTDLDPLIHLKKDVKHRLDQAAPVMIQYSKQSEVHCNTMGEIEKLLDSQGLPSIDCVQSGRGSSSSGNSSALAAEASTISSDKAELSSGTGSSSDMEELDSRRRTDSNSSSSSNIGDKLPVTKAKKSIATSAVERAIEKFHSQDNSNNAKLWSSTDGVSFVKAVALYGRNFDSVARHVNIHSKVSKTPKQCKIFFNNHRHKYGFDDIVRERTFK